jgi:hypothetical protein
MKLIDLTRGKLRKVSTRRMLAGALGLLLALGLLASLAVPAFAIPQIPHQFWGNVTIGGVPAPEDTVVMAEVRGVEKSTTVDALGRYGYSPTFKVPADDPDTGGIEGGRNGDTISFYVGAVLATTYTFQIGAGTRLDLEVPGEDVTPPRVVSTSPANGATGVPVNTLVTATFSEPVNPATIVFSLDGVSGSLSYAATTATFDPSANLSYSTTYTASIQTSDLAGNPMAEAYTWSFTTQSFPELPGTLGLVGGVNIIAYTGATASLPGALTNIGPDGDDVVDIIWARGLWTGRQWLYYDPGVGYNTLSQLEAGRAYIIVVTEGLYLGTSRVS